MRSSSVVAAVRRTFLTYCMRQGGAALRDLPGLAVGGQRAQRAAQVDPVVLVEAGVLDGDDRLLQQRVDPVDAHDDAVLGVERREPAAVGREQDGLLGQRWGLEDVGDVLVAVGRGAGREADGADEGQGQTGDEHARNDADQHEQHHPGDGGADAMHADEGT